MIQLFKELRGQIAQILKQEGNGWCPRVLTAIVLAWAVVAVGATLATTFIVILLAHLLTSVISWIVRAFKWLCAREADVDEMRTGRSKRGINTVWVHTCCSKVQVWASGECTSGSFFGPVQVGEYTLIDGDIEKTADHYLNAALTAAEAHQ